MAAKVSNILSSPISIRFFRFQQRHSNIPTSDSFTLLNLNRPSRFSAGIISDSLGLRSYTTAVRRVCRDRTSVTASMLPENPITRDVCVATLTGCVALSLLRFWGEMAKLGILEQKISRKLVHISVGLVFMLFWPLFSSGNQAAILAALVPGVNIIRMLLIGLGLWKDEAIVKSMSRYGDYRELLKGPLYYAATITLACAIYWRTSPIAIAAICNLCAGDGLADIVGRRFGSLKLPYNRNKSFAGSIAMTTAGFIASIMYMHYFSLFGLVHESWEMVFGFFIVSLLTAVVESLPISSELDDNLTVPLTSVLIGSFVF
ncbi:probable phytol kinase 2, chloroplastic [Telopea speciosissima]|uniref:probable phytol kinase 2, chloroplastic n=1 Tax=Telopea speciosissima TaxID=54955 RepID=UPI001CC3EC5B|nr:probable phytol kinase 2, chloroplastic [Telopea speciosissima]